MNIGFYNYIVKTEDTIEFISKQFKVSVEEMKSINNISWEIQVGQNLKIPGLRYERSITKKRDILVLVNKNNRLPLDYIPKDLVIPNVPFPFEEFHSKKLMRQNAAYALEELFSQAKKDNIDLYATSGYRSYSRQEFIFTSYVMEKGIELANKTSAKPGESEHQTGLAMDVTCQLVDFELTESFGDIEEGRWLKENASNHGFIIRYPKGKEHITGYSYEPWHIRYVGREVAKTIMKKDITLEEFLVNNS